MLEVAEVDLVPGLVVADRWRLERVIGKGGFGIVWAAVDVRTGEPRALKCLTQDGAHDGKRQERLRREARAMSSITHPNIARVFGLEELPAGTPFIVMDLLQGLTLHARLHRGALAIPQARGILIQIADALRTVHARGIVHRDLKPANVFIVDQSTVKVLDFGIAKDLSSSDRHKLTTTGTTLGTLSYMAPEQIFGERDLDGRCDVWALGVIAHECLTLRRPSDADGDNTGQVLKKILDGDFPRLSKLVAGCPADLDVLVARMLSRKPADRPTSEEVFATLSRTANAMTAPPTVDFGRTVRDENFGASQLVPSTVVPPTDVASKVAPPTVVNSGVPFTLVPSTAVPPTAVPSTLVPSTVVASTVMSAGNAPPAPVTLAAAAVTPPKVAATVASAVPVRRPSDEPTFDVRGRSPSRRSPLVAVIVAVVAGLAIGGVALFLIMSGRLRRSTDDLAKATSASAQPSAAAPTPTPVVQAPPPPASSPSPSASATTASSAAPAIPSSAARRTAAPPGRTAPASRPTSQTGKDDPLPISDERF